MNLVYLPSGPQAGILPPAWVGLGMSLNNCGPQSSIHKQSFSKHLVSTYYMPSVIFSAEGQAAEKKYMTSASWSCESSGSKQAIARVSALLHTAVNDPRERTGAAGEPCRLRDQGSPL